MKNILLLGGGRSSSNLMKYLGEGHIKDVVVNVFDLDVALVKEKTKNYHNFNVLKDISLETIENEIRKNDVVISMLPAHMHIDIAKKCLQEGKSMLTASYASKEMKTLHQSAKDKGLLFLNEIGVDPGIDHMSAMKIIDKIKQQNGVFMRFESFTGGLIAPECDDNPWNYKFTWNPRNVVIAGQGGPVKFIHNGKYKYIPYHKLFRRTEFIEIEGYGRFEGYANRDSLNYIEVYGLEGIPTIYRGTLRRPGFCRAWDVFVQLGLTDDGLIIEHCNTMSHRDFVNSFLSFSKHDSVELKLQHYLHIDQDSDLMEKLEWIGLFSDEKIGLESASPAQILQHILEKKWTLKPKDKDMIVMWHQFQYTLEGKYFEIESSMVCKGEDRTYTAMSKTVGLPLGIACKLFLEGKITKTGVILPIHPELYLPILKELEKFGIVFQEKSIELPIID